MRQNAFFAFSLLLLASSLLLFTSFAEDIAKTNPVSERMRGHEGTEWSQWNLGGMYNLNDKRVILDQ